MTQLRVLVPLLALPVAACVGDGDREVIIIQNNVPSTGCSIPASLDSAFYPSGIIDTNSDRGYLLTPVIQNFSEAQTEADETRRLAFIEGALVDLSFGDPDLFSDSEEAELRDDGLTRFDVPLAAVVGAGDTVSLGFEIIPRQLFDRMALAAGDSTVVLANVRIYGEMGGSGFESQTYRYPVEVCNGCLIVDNGQCAALPSDFAPRTGGACNPLQDGYVDCCTAPTGLLCPAVPPSE